MKHEWTYILVYYISYLLNIQYNDSAACDVDLTEQRDIRLLFLLPRLSSSHFSYSSTTTRQLSSVDCRLYGICLVTYSRKLATVITIYLRPTH